ncbi:MAG TPA: M1 family aminopeptidase [Myxococcota bacterium]|nr:M1 family aminopeptidase [Myxococcota bacterium]
MLPFWIALSSAPPKHGAPGVEAPDRHWDLVHLELDLELSPAAGRIEGSATLSVEPMLPPASELRLDQVGLQIDEVLIDGEATTWRSDDTHLHVELDPSGSHEVYVAYSAEPETGLHFRGDGPDTYTEVWSQGEGEDNRHWLPLWDHPNDRFTYRGTFRAPKGYSVLSNGVGGQNEDGSWTWELTEGDLVAYLVMVAAAEYQRVELDGGPVPIEWWLPPDATVEQAHNAAGRLPEMLRFFGELSGLPYPWANYREVYVQRFMYTGMENTTATVMHRRVLIDDEFLGTRRGSESVVAHELAHQWYGDTLTCRSWHEIWLNEGFATFFSAEWMRHADGDEQFYANVAQRYDGSHTGPLAGRFWSTPEGDHPPSQNVYAKGSSVLQMLRVMLGEEAFWAGIHRYTTENAMGMVETDDLRRAFEDVTGLHLRWFFDQWVHLPGGAELKVSQSWDNDAGILTVHVEQVEKLLVLPIDIEVGLSEESQRQRLWLDGESASVTFELEGAPAYVAIDPDAGLLAHVEVDQSNEMWQAQATRSTPYARVRAIEALSKDGDNEDFLVGIAANVAAATAYRLEAIDALVGGGSGAELAELLDDEDERVRKKAAEALYGSTAEVGAELRAAWRSERQPDVRASILRSLRPHDESFARRVALAEIKRPTSTHNPVHNAALNVLKKAGESNDLAAVLRLIREETHREVLHTGIWTAVGIAERQDGKTRDRAREDLARELEPLVASTDLRTRQTAVSALGKVGDSESTSVLKAYRKLTRLQEQKDSATRAIDAIRDRKDPAKETDAEVGRRLEKLEDDLEGLRREVDEMKERY